MKDILTGENKIEVRKLDKPFKQWKGRLEGGNVI